MHCYIIKFFGQVKNLPLFAYKSETYYPPGYVIVIVFVSAFQSTVAPRFSVTNLKGSIVLLFIISGTTFELSGSI